MRSLLAMFIVIGSFSSSMAQGAKIEFNNELGGYYTGKMSTNGRYITCGVGNADAESTAALWDRETNKTTILGFPTTAHDVSNDGIVVGAFMDPEVTFGGQPVMSGGWCKDGVWHSLGVHPDHPINTVGGNGSQTAAISADGEYIAGHVFLSPQKLVPCIWKRNVDGEYVFHKEYSVFENSFQGGRPWDMSDEGQVLVGWDSMSTQGSFWQPTMWTDTDAIVRPEGALVGGALTGVTPDGTVAVGYGGGGGIMIKSDNTYKLFPISLTSVASNGMITTRDGIWTEEIGVWELIPYLKKFWNIEVDESRYITDVVYTISGDGKYIGGVMLDNNIRSRRPFVVTLEGYPVALAPDVVNTTLKQVAGEVIVEWEVPYYNGYEVLGYNVYRGEQKLNTELLQDLTFTDVDPEVGANCYSITAVYKYDVDKESAKSIVSCVEVIAEDGCFSPKHLAADIVYNRTVKLAWGMPLPNYGSIQPEKSAKNDEPTKLKPLYLKKYELGATNNYEIHPASDGNNIYLINYNDNFFKYTADGDFVQRFKLGSPFLANYWGGLTYYDGFYYTTSTMMPNGINVKLDLDNKTIVENFNSPVSRQKYRISYLAGLDGGEGGFEIGTDTSSYFYKKDLLTEIGVGLKNVADVCGTAYHDGKIYATIQKEGELIIKLFDVTTGEYANEYIDLKDYTNMSFTETAKLGGITTFKSTEGILCLAVVVMDSPKNSLVFLQLENMEGLLGYNVYRNGVKINAMILQETIFTEDVITPGNYEYTVTSLFEGDCESSKSFPVNITITPTGVCNTPKDINVEMIRNNSQITWTAPQATAPHSLVGYNIYCNDEKLNDKLITNTFFTHTKLPFGEYSYQVEAFYNNSCVSDKSVPVVINIDGYNVPTAPENLNATVEGNQAIVNWDIPAIGNYANLRWYNGAIEWSVGEEDEDLVYVASKWNADDLSVYFDYTLTDVEFFPSINTPHTFYIYVDGEVVSEQYLATVTPNAFNLLTLDRPVMIEKGKELMVGYKIAGKKGVYPIGADQQANKSGKGDLISYDGVNWKSLYNDYGVAANWAITIRLMPYTIKTEPNATPLNIEMEAVEQGAIGFKNIDTKSEDRSIFINKEVIGYNVYKDGNKIETVTTNNYKQTIDNSLNVCYSVEAIYTSDRISPMSESVCIYGECQPATKLTGTAEKTTVDLKWEAPTGETTNAVEIKYYQENTGGAVIFSQAFKLLALIQSTVIENTQYEKLKLKSIEALVLGDCKISIVAIQNGKIIMEEEMNGITVGEYNTFEVSNGGFEIDPSKGILVGLKVDAPAGLTIGVDPGPAVTNRGDIIGTDPTDLTTLFAMGGSQLNVNWNISANFEEVISSNETVTEYNIYRNGVKIDSSNTASFTDTNAEPNTEYTYHVTTLWNTGCESEKSNVLTVQTIGVGVDGINANNIFIYPNPAKSNVNVKGEYTSLKIYNSAGVPVLETEKSDSINVEHLQSGIYVIELYDNNNIISRAKLVITK